MTDWSHTPHPRTCAYLESIGIDPTTVCEDGLDYTGYYTFVYEEDDPTRRRCDDGGAVREFHEWPDAEVAMRAVAAFQEDFAQGYGRWGAGVAV